MGETDLVDSLVDYLTVERASHGGLTLDLQTMQDCIEQKGLPGLASETELAAGQEPLAPELGRFRPVPKRSRGELRSSSEQLKPGRAWAGTQAKQRRGTAPHAPNNAGHRLDLAWSTNLK